MEEPEEEGVDWAKLPTRRKARAVALQVLCEVDSTHHQPEEALLWLLEEEALPKGAEPFARGLVAGVLKHRGEIDALIQTFAPAWPVHQLSVVDRNLLRLAIYELRVEGQAPPKAVINEAVELAKLFGSDSSPRFVNGVLGSVLEATGASAKTS